MKGIIIGAGEVGRSLHEVFSPVYETDIVDVGQEGQPQYEIMHIAFPFSDKFLDYAEAYVNRYKPTYIVVHSTVRPGITRELQKRFPNLFVAHSPIRGRHPHIAESIKTFVKYIGYLPETEAGKNGIETVNAYFKNAGVTTTVFDRTEDTEVGKILDTTKLGIDVIAARMFDRVCRAYGADYQNAVADFNKTYNEGYSALGASFYSRPILKPSEEPIGGHCVKPNLALIPDNNEWEVIKSFILENELRQV